MKVDVAITGVPELAARLKNWAPSMRRKMRSALIQIGNSWVMGAKRRVPVETGLLRNSINKTVEITPKMFELAVGSNVRYAPHIEFGTEHIAGGRVKALGMGPVILDGEAITTWPAQKKRRARKQQMPFLRPAFQEIKGRAIELLNEALEPPKA